MTSKKKKKPPPTKAFTGAPFKVGDQVTTAFGTNPGDEAADIVRRVSMVMPSSISESGWLICTEGTDPCDSCGHKAAEIIGAEGIGIDSSWFKKWSWFKKIS